jgi:cellobiose transport system substrate-binding protein
MRTKHFSRRRSGLAVAAFATVSILVSACSGGSEGEPKATEDPFAPVTLKVSTFGLFGYEKLYKQYTADHPDVKIVPISGPHIDKYTAALVKQISTGKGAADIVAIEEGSIAQFIQQPDKFVNFQDYGSNELKGNWLEWKYNQATTTDGKKTIGLGTDVGGLAMCYRKDLFAAAGLETDRDKVSALWPSWTDYMNVGRKFKRNTSGNKKFVDSVSNTYNSILMQVAGQAPGYTYFDRQNRFVMDTNPAVKSAWNTMNQVLSSGLSANLEAFTPAWEAGFKNDAFATIACPAWMTGNIQEYGGAEGKGNWDIASVPGGAGSWGGSFLAVPAQSKHKAAAIELVKFLTSPAGQMEAFDAAGNLPSSPQDHADPVLLDARNPYFNNAPQGALFIKGAVALRPVYLGAKNQVVREAVEGALRLVEQGKMNKEDAWTKAVKDAKAKAGVKA